MTPDELKALRVGDTVWIGKSQTEITKVGRKWLHYNNGKIDIARACTSHPQYAQREESIFRTKGDYEAYLNYCAQVNKARALIRDFPNQRHKNEEFIAVANYINHIKEKGANAPFLPDPSEYD